MSKTRLEVLGKREPELATRIIGRVARGAGVMDEVRPGWFREVDRDRLAMESCTDCIIGQIHGRYISGIFMGGYLRGGSASSIGLTLPDREQDYEDGDDEAEATVQLRFDALGDAWRAEIRKRLKEQP